MVFKVDFSEDDFDAKGTSAAFELLPAGDYKCVISDIELREVNSEANKGKLMWNMQLTVENGDNDKFNGRKLWTNIMLFTLFNKQTGKPNNFFLAQLLNAVGFGDAMRNGEIPEGEEFLGQTLIVNVQNKKNNRTDKMENVVKGFMRIDNAPSAKGKKSSLLP